MTGTRRVGSWLRLAFALVLSLGLSSAAAATAASEGLASQGVAAAVTQVHATASAATHATVLRAGAELRHAVSKHRPTATASALVVAAVVLTGVAAATFRRRRTDVRPSPHVFSRGARAPPVVVGI